MTNDKKKDAPKVAKWFSDAVREIQEKDSLNKRHDASSDRLNKRVETLYDNNPRLNKTCEPNKCRLNKTMKTEYESNPRINKTAEYIKNSKLDK